MPYMKNKDDNYYKERNQDWPIKVRISEKAMDFLKREKEKEKKSFAQLASEAIIKQYGREK